MQIRNANNEVLFEMETEDVSSALRRAGQQGVSLRGAAISGQTIAYADISGNLSYAIFRNCKIIGNTFVGCNLVRAVFENCEILYSRFSCCDLSTARFTDTSAKDCEFTLCRLNMASLNKVNLHNTSLENSDTTRWSLADVSVNGGKLIGEGVLGVSRVGSRDAPLVAFFTDKGLLLSTGCQNQITVEHFVEQLEAPTYAESFPEAYEDYQQLLKYLEWRQKVLLKEHMESAVVVNPSFSNYLERLAVQAGIVSEPCHICYAIDHVPASQDHKRRAESIVERLLKEEKKLQEESVLCGRAYDWASDILYERLRYEFKPPVLRRLTAQEKRTARVQILRKLAKYHKSRGD